MFEVYDDLPDRPVSPHNFVTAKGLELIEAELAHLHREHAAAQDADDRPRVAKINRDVVYSLRLEDAKTALLAQGAEAVPTTPEEFGAFIQSEIARWGEVLKRAGIPAQ